MQNIPEPKIIHTPKIVTTHLLPNRFTQTCNKKIKQWKELGGGMPQNHMIEGAASFLK